MQCYVRVCRGGVERSFCRRRFLRSVRWRYHHEYAHANGALQRDVVDEHRGGAAEGAGGAARSRHRRYDHDGGADRGARALHRIARGEALHGASVVREPAERLRQAMLRVDKRKRNASTRLVNTQWVNDQMFNYTALQGVEQGSNPCSNKRHFVSFVYSERQFLGRRL
jgi:hypothetical protein